MRVLALFVPLVVAAWAQTPPASLIGTARSIAGDHIVVQTGAGTTTLYADGETKVWRGRSGNVLTIVRPGDAVWVRYRQGSARPLILDLYANITHVWGRISKVAETGFEVDQNFNADPQSGYRRGKRQITFTSDTEFRASTRQDLRVGRTVDIVGLKTASGVQAARVAVYDGGIPIRMPGERVIGTDGVVRNLK